MPAGVRTGRVRTRPPDGETEADHRDRRQPQRRPLLRTGSPQARCSREPPLGDSYCRAVSRESVRSAENVEQVRGGGNPETYVARIEAGLARDGRYWARTSDLLLVRQYQRGKFGSTSWNLALERSA